MTEKVNAFVHMFSALYSGVFTSLAWFLAPPSYFSRSHLAALLTTGTAAVALDFSAAVKQWRSHPSGYLLSIALHFLFAIAVVATMTFDHAQSKPSSLVWWFATRNYLFVSLIALVRVFVATNLIVERGR
jgi:hypothetical protein